MRLFYFVFLVVFFLFTGNATSQRYLKLSKSNSRFSVLYAEGESIRFRLKGEKFFSKALIQGFGEDYMRLHYYKIKFSEIAEIDIRNKLRRNSSISSASGTLIVAGALYMVIDQFNQVVISGEPLDPHPRTIVASTSIIGTGFLLKLFRKNRFKLHKKRHKIEILGILPGN